MENFESNKKALERARDRNKWECTGEYDGVQHLVSPSGDTKIKVGSKEFKTNNSNEK